MFLKMIKPYVMPRASVNLVSRCVLPELADCRGAAGGYTVEMKFRANAISPCRYGAVPRIFTLGIAGLLLAACEPAPESARRMRASQETEPLPPTPVVTMSEAEVLELVKEQPAPEGEGTVTDWIERRMRSTRGQPLFPRWTVQRRAASRFEVRFTYTWVGLDNQIENRGYVWHVDGAVSTVQGPKVMVAGDWPRARSIAEQQQRRAENPEYNLR